MTLPTNDTLDFGHGWVPEPLVQITVPVSRKRLTLEEKSRNNELLVNGILNKDSTQVQEALDNGASVTQKINYEKMGPVAVRMFESSIVEALDKAGCNFGDVGKMWYVAYRDKNMEAMAWLINRANSIEKTQLYSDTLSKGNSFSLDVAIMITSNNPQVVDEVMKKRKWAVVSGLGSALEHNHKWLDNLAGVSTSHLKEVMSAWIDDRNQLRTINYAACLNLKSWASKYPQVFKALQEATQRKKEVAPEDKSAHHVQMQVYMKKAQDQQREADLKALGWGDDLTDSYKGIQSRSFLEALVINGSPAVLGVLRSEKGRKGVVEVLKNPLLARKFATACKDELFLDALDAAPELVAWRDAQNNTLGHYHLYGQHAHTKAFLDRLISTAPEWFMAENDAKRTLASFFKGKRLHTQDLEAYITQKLMKKTLSGSGVTRQKTKEAKAADKAGPKRRM